MSKRIGTSLLLALTMLVSTISFGVTTIYAAPACLTISECLNIASEARDNISEIVGQESKLGDKIAELNGEIATLSSEIGSLEVSISATKLQISELQDEITENTELLEETGEEIEDLMDAVGERMIISQRMENRNTLFVVLSESDDLTDFISQLRFFSKVANADADVMDQLTELLDLYDGLIAQLHDQVELYGEIQEELEAEQANLESKQEVLADLEAELREELYELGVQRMTEEEALAAAESAREVLERTPPPPVTTTTNTGSSSGNGSGSSTQASSSGSVASAGTNSGLSHPMPGSRVTSEFGPRWGGHHSGIDVQIFGARPSILAAASGTVTVNTWHNALGWYVIIAHDINGQRVDTLYAHLESQSSAATGTVVSQGEAIGIQGNTGFSTGAHLHFEVHPGGFSWNGGVNPRNWINF
jgi:murein DD-endopeptidase MepM/ murein hydrolase activator NlpD